MPRTMRELFEFLSYYDSDRGLDDLLGTLDTSGVTPAHVYNIVFNRAPENVELAAPGPDYDARQHFREALLSTEFRHGLLRNFLAAFPEKGRDVFIHVPKCAGTDLIFSLAHQRLPLPKMLEVTGWVSNDEFLAALGGIARAASSYDRIFTYGHMELGEYIDAAGIRPDDRLFTIIRDPLDLMLSQANYAVGRLRQDPAGRNPDTAETLEYLGINSLQEPLTDRDLKDLAIRCLHNPRITQPNRACLYLGKEMQTNYSQAMSNIVTHNIEITTTDCYMRWLRERWGITESLRHNQSDKLLTRTEVQRSHAHALKPLIAQDRMLFDVVSWALAQTGKASVTGIELARLAGPGLLGEFPVRLQAGQVAGWRPGKGDGPRDLLVAQEPDWVSMYLEQPSVTIPDCPTERPLLEIGFGEGGSGRDYLRDGWSVTEDTFTWTDSDESRLQFPPLPQGGRCVLRLIGHPFVLPPAVGSQRVEVLVNGDKVGAARIHDLAVIELDIPPASVDKGDPITITLRLPDAAKPGDLGHPNDFRLLGFALHKAILFEQPDSAPAGNAGP